MFVQFVKQIVRYRFGDISAGKFTVWLSCATCCCPKWLTISRSLNENELSMFKTFSGGDSQQLLTVLANLALAGSGANRQSFQYKANELVSFNDEQNSEKETVQEKLGAVESDWP